MDEIDETAVGPTESHDLATRLQDAQLAWSDDDDDTEPDAGHSWSSTWQRAAVVLSTGAVLAAVTGVIGWTVVHHHDDQAPQVTTYPAYPTHVALPTPVYVAVPTVTVTAAPAPTVTAAPPSPTTPALPPGFPSTVAYPATNDPQFLALIRSDGLMITKDRALTLNVAHEVCHNIGQGQSSAYVTSMVSDQTGMVTSEAQRFVEDVLMSYPDSDCGRSHSGQ